MNRTMRKNREKNKQIYKILTPCFRRAALAFAAAAAVFLMSGIKAKAGQWGLLEGGTWVYWEGDQKLTGWHWIDGNGDGTAECYYFSSDGTMCANMPIDGWQLNPDGAWVQNGVVQTKAVTPGSHHPAGAGSAFVSSATQNMASSGAYTPQRARAEAVSLTVSGPQAPYQGKVWTYDDYYIAKKDALPGQISYTKRCLARGCCNPQGSGLYCDVHTCKEPGCSMGVALSVYNAGYCYTHMKAHGIDDIQFEKLEQAEQRQNAQREAAAQAAAYGTGTAGASSKSSSKSTSSSSSKSSSGTSSGSRSSSSCSSVPSSGNPSATASGSSAKKSTSSRDSYDEGYDDVYYHEEYDDERYRTDWDYMSGVDDAMDELGEDW